MIIDPDCGSPSPSLRPRYDFPLSSLEDDLNSRAVVFQHIPVDARVLDIGCDTGRFGQVLREKKNCVVHGIESFRDAAEDASTRLDHVFLRSVDSEDSLTDLSGYNVVLLLDVLEHLRDPWAVLRGVHGLLKPGGLLQIVVPNIAHLSVVKRLLLGRFDYTEHGTMDRTHLRWFTRSSLADLMKETGFVQVEIGIVPLIPRLDKRKPMQRRLIKLLGQMFPDQTAGSLIGCGRRP